MPPSTGHSGEDDRDPGVEKDLKMKVARGAAAVIAIDLVFAAVLLIAAGMLLGISARYFLNKYVTPIDADPYNWWFALGFTYPLLFAYYLRMRPTYKKLQSVIQQALQ